MKRKFFISFVSTLLCIGLMFNLTVVGFAESKKTEYPFIFVHGPPLKSSEQLFLSAFISVSFP